LNADNPDLSSDRVANEAATETEQRRLDPGAEALACGNPFLATWQERWGTGRDVAVRRSAKRS
jgi:hypothetical protein